jgi:hypothetical protein
MKKIAVAALILTFSSAVNATVVSADADGFASGTNISMAFSGIRLSSVGGYSGLSDAVYAWADGLASTGSAVFANNLSFQRQWCADFSGEGFALRADFYYAAMSVAIDIIGDDPTGTDVGGLYAYDSAGNLLESAVSGGLACGQVFTAQITRPGFDIAYIIAGGSQDAEDTVHLDNLTADIPEPVTGLLFGIGGLVFARRGKK